jgi:hypothetical protein
MFLAGVDIFLDSVGGSMYNTIVTKHIKMGGRICIFGNLSLYNNLNNLNNNNSSSNNDDHVPPHDLIISLKVFLSTFLKLEKSRDVYLHENGFYVE